MNEKLEILLDKYLEIKDNFDTNEDRAELIDLIIEISEIVMNTTFVVPVLVDEIDDKDKAIVDPNDIDGLSPVYADIREEGSDDDYIRLLSLCTNEDKVPEAMDVNCVIKLSFKELYKVFIINNENVKGIFINPQEHNFILDRKVCELIYNRVNKVLN